MMTTPRVTEIPVPMAPVEPDPFIGPPRASAVRQRLVEREARERRTELVLSLTRTRAAQRHRGG